MPFRAPEAAEMTRLNAIESLTEHFDDPKMQQKGVEALDALVERFGPFVDRFPVWHPLVSFGDQPHKALVNPVDLYPGLDHPRYLRNAILSTPYDDRFAETQERVKEIAEKTRRDVLLGVERVKAPLHHERTYPIVIYCLWCGDDDFTEIPQRQAVARMLEVELRGWRHAEVGETVETMRPYLLGSPHGRRSSLFVDEAVGKTLISVYRTVVNAGVFGPLYRRGSR